MKLSPLNIKNYIKELNSQFSTRQGTEHSYRSALEKLLKEATGDVEITNEPKQITGVGAPDFVLTRKNIPLGYIETKDIGKNLDDPVHKEQLSRYTEALDNLIFTNYTEFRLFRGGEQVKTVNIADLIGGKVKPLPDNFESFKSLLQNFINYQGLTVKTASDLADYMAAKARMLAREIEAALSKDGDTNSNLQNQLEALREYLIRDIKPSEFADIYAQTVAYGMFAARLHDKIPDTFSREDAAKLIPASNPFLRKFFQHIAGNDLDRTIHWIVNELADLFRAADVGELMKEYGKPTQKNDPFLHFYETFLSKYNSKLRKSRGVYYTPEPVVNFIVRAVDNILEKELNLPDGIADTGKIVIEIDPLKKKDNKDKIKVEKLKRELHKVQILDPAAGTGTFLAAIAQWIYQERYADQKGIWESYVRDHLIPRLNGFELLMAPYTMAHTKLEMVLRETGCESQSQDRLRIFLTNSLEEHHTDTSSLYFAQWLSIEAKEANAIKRDTPVMVVIGNPPYSGESANKGKWISELLETYKQEPSGGKLKERNPKPINDDYVKFIRYGQHYIDRVKEGVLAYINNHSFLDNLTFRGMRYSLLQSFDKIYIIDLHGNSKKKETAPDGSTDKNVFDIQQGVSINLFIKTGKKKEGELGKVFHYDLWGSRESKYQFLWDKYLNSIDFTELKPQSPYYFFVPKDWANKDEYDKGFSVKDLFTENLSSIVTGRDSFTIYKTEQDLRTSISDFRAMDDETARVNFSLGPDTQNWEINLARKDLEENVFGNDNDKPAPISYRPFDIRYTYYTGNSKGFHCRPRGEVMHHFLAGENLGLIFKRGNIEEKAAPVFLSKYISESRSWSRPGMQGAETSAPLYLYTNPPHLNNKILTIRKNANLTLI